MGVIDRRIAIAGVHARIPPEGEQAFDCSYVMGLRVHV
jgi:hypothetical protein